MPAYLIVEHRITDPAKFDAYRTKVAPIIARFGGNYLTKAGTHRFLENTPSAPDRVAIIEFPSMEALEAWYRAPDYQPLIRLRLEAVDQSVDRLMVIDGA